MFEKSKAWRLVEVQRLRFDHCKAGIALQKFVESVLTSLKRERLVEFWSLFWKHVDPTPKRVGESVLSTAKHVLTLQKLGELVLSSAKRVLEMWRTRSYFRKACCRCRRVPFKHCNVQFLLQQKEYQPCRCLKSAFRSPQSVLEASRSADGPF